jgi:hypothetical protein
MEDGMWSDDYSVKLPTFHHMVQACNGNIAVGLDKIVIGQLLQEILQTLFICIHRTFIMLRFL